jgi:dTDP-4-dehydrorhamnose reductase
VRALVTGAAGQLSVELLRSVPSQIEVVGVERKECDITDSNQVEATVDANRPHVIINAAAFTAVDAAESAPDRAHLVNATGARNVARAAQRVGARIIHVSTDYVFDGESREPYRPDSDSNPINAYGASKLAGEKAVCESAPDALIVRSSWLYASHGKNFLKTILSALRSANPLQVVSDQTGVPTSARSLAETIWECVEHHPELRGIQHWVDGGTASWYDFAVEIGKLAVQRGLVEGPVQIEAVRSEQYRTPARRPRYSVLDARALSEAIGRRPRQWRSRR